MNDLPRWKKQTDIDKLASGEYCPINPQTARTLVKTLGYRLPRPGYELNLGNGLYICHGPGTNFEVRRYSR